MTADYSYLDIAVVNYAPSGKTSCATFGNATGVDTTAVAELYSRFVNLQQGIVMSCTPSRRTFTLILANELADTPHTVVQLSFDANAIIDGRRLINLMHSLAQVPVSRLSDDNAFRGIIHTASMPGEPLRSNALLPDAPSAAQQAVRSYLSSTDLVNLLSYCRQPDYLNLSSVMFIPATVSMYPDRALPHITTPLSKKLLVVTPPGVTASHQAVDLSEPLTLIYSRQGFDSVKLEFEIADTNRYVRIAPPALIVNSAMQAGITFSTSIGFTVTDAATNIPLSAYTLLVNGRTASRSDNTFVITDRDFVAGHAHLSVMSTNYVTWSTDLTPSSLATLSRIDIAMHPDTGSFILRLNFGNGRIIDAPVDIEKGTQEYSNLHAGTFHGYRANRVAGTIPETYIIDLASAPLNTNCQPTPLQSVDIKKPDSDQSTDSGHTPITQPTGSAIGRARGFMRRTLYITAAIFLTLLVWLIMGMPGVKSSDENLGTQTTDSTAVETVAPADTLKTVDSTPEQKPSLAHEQADIAYLNANNVWHIDSLHSDSYRSLLRLITDGQLDSIARHPYFATPGLATNSQAEKIANLIWAANGSDTQVGNIRYLRSLNINDPIKLNDVFIGLSGRRPHTPNKSPRPNSAN